MWTSSRNTKFFRRSLPHASVPCHIHSSVLELYEVNRRLGFSLDITPVDPAHPFELPPTGDTVIDFEKFSRVLKPGRICGDKPRHPVLQMLWGIVTQTNVDHAELLWEEFTQGFRTILLHTSSPIASPERPKKKVSSLSFIPSAFT
ncbi:hypothetical protein Tco_0261632 [Tanacetum coccineum]